MQPQRHLGDDRPFFGKAMIEIVILARVDLVNPAGEHGHRAVFKPAFMGVTIDPPGHAGDNYITVPPEIIGKVAGKPAGVHLRIAGADHGDQRFLEQ